MASIYDDEEAVDALKGIDLPPLTERERITGFVRTFEFNEAKAAYRRWRDAEDAQLSMVEFERAVAEAVATGSEVEFANRHLDESARVLALYEEFDRAHREFLKVMTEDDDDPRTNYVGTEQD